MARPKAQVTIVMGCVLASACVSDALSHGDLPTEADGVEADGGACALDERLLASAAPLEGIPALTLPAIVAADDPRAQYLDPTSRVLGVVVDGQARAYPHNILWWHEIVNDTIGGEWISVTFCPLTGSGLAFDPHVAGERLELGVSGLLFANNLVLYDRLSRDVYGPQLAVEGKCHGFRGQEMTLRGVQEMSWGRWLALHPNTKVVGDRTGFSRAYEVYPYGSYDRVGNNELLVRMSTDRTRPMKERVLAVRGEEGDGRGYPFGELRLLGDRAAVNEFLGVPYAVFYEADDGEAAVAYAATVDGTPLLFEVAPGGLYRDLETGSLWTFGGEAVSGTLAGRRLAPLANAYVLFWFAWRHFEPRARWFSGG